MTLPHHAPIFRATLAAAHPRSADGPCCSGARRKTSSSHAPQDGKGQPRTRRVLRMAASRSAAVMTPRAKTRSSTRSRAAARRIRKTIRPPRFRRLRQGDKQRGLGNPQAFRLLAEISKARRAHAFDIAAIGREAQDRDRELSILSVCHSRSHRAQRSAALSPRPIFRRAAPSDARPASLASNRRRRSGHGSQIAARRGPRLGRSTP